MPFYLKILSLVKNNLDDQITSFGHQTSDLEILYRSYFTIKLKIWTTATIMTSVLQK